MRGRYGLGLGLLIAAALSACAAQGPFRRDHAGLDGVFSHRPALFVSPTGEPFRSVPGEGPPVTRWFTAADTDHDGRLGREEFRKDAERFFRTLDTDGDGTISGIELARYEQDVAPEIVSDFPPDLESMSEGGSRGGGGGSGGSGMGNGGVPPARASRADALRGAAWFSLLNVAEPVASADRDLDGNVSLDEFLRTADDRFVVLGAGADALIRAKLPRTPAQKFAAGPAWRRRGG